MIKSDGSAQPANQGLMLVKGVLVAICFFAGAFGVFFFIWKQNFSASFSCLELELVCVMLLQINAAVMKGTLHTKFNLTRMKIVFIVSVIVAVAAFVGTVSYAAMGAINKQDFQIENNGYYVAIIPSALCCIWSTLLAFESRKHMAAFAIAGGATTMGQFS